MTYSFFPKRLTCRLGLAAACLLTVGGTLLYSMQPAQATVAKELSQLTADFNLRLSAEIETITTSLPDIHIALLDVETLFADVLPTEFTETTQSCVQGPPLAPASAPSSICPNPHEYLFFDEVHPTAQAHGRIADSAIAAIAQDIPGEVTELFIFGDSLSDRGNVFGFSNGTFPLPAAIKGPLLGEPLYAQGSFTNGSVWWQFITENWGVSDPLAYYEEVLTDGMPDNLDGGINFAVGGATTGTDNTGNAQNPPFPVDLPGLQDQIATFKSLLEPGERANPDAVYVIWAAPNNLLGAFLPEDRTNPFGPFDDFTTDMAEPVADIRLAIKVLYARGARKFLIGNMYDLGNTPLAQDLELLNSAAEAMQKR